ncbi:MAG: amino acid ABC transporter permease [Desulfobacterales bacterium]|nr:amino acid ABC transporter permease [Desulfobacterales bacterium]
MFNKPSNRITLVDMAALGLAAAAISFFLSRMGSVLAYDWNWSAIPQYFIFWDEETGIWTPNILLRGFFTTIKLSVWATVLAVIIGTLSGVMGARGNGFQRFVSRIYVEIVRNIPSLVLLIIFYYFVSSQFLDMLGLDAWLRAQPEGIRRAVAFLWADAGSINAFVSAVAALALYEGAYISEIVRGGILGVPQGQWEAASAIGLSGPKTFRLVILPQAFRQVAFPLAGQFISTIKDSAIVSVISIQELTFQGMELMAATFLTFEVWITVTLLYFVLTFSLSAAINALEKRSAPRG